MTNWFKIGIFTLALFYVVAIYYSLFLETKKHTLGVLTEIRQCLKDFDGRTETQCSNLAHQQLIFEGYFYRTEGKEFEDGETAIIPSHKDIIRNF